MASGALIMGAGDALAQSIETRVVQRDVDAVEDRQAISGVLRSAVVMSYSVFFDTPLNLVLLPIIERSFQRLQVGGTLSVPMCIAKATCVFAPGNSNPKLKKFRGIT